jgi:hypothetical protein
MYYIGIVGSEAAKFTDETRKKALEQIIQILDTDYDEGPVVLVSGGCHLGGIDIWAEELADDLGIPKKIFRPKNLQWATGYKPRNIEIATVSDIVYCITLRELPPTYTGMVFDGCYHCAKRNKNYPLHVKSGGCWTAWYAKEILGKRAEWIII